MTDDSIEAKALALVNEICLEKGVIPYAKLPNIEASEALCRAIEQHEAFKQEVSDAWQPIETAPLDWEPILVWAISEDEWEDAQDEERKPVYSAMVARHSSIQQGLWWLCASSMVAVKQPTHWQPLPKAPE